GPDLEREGIAIEGNRARHVRRIQHEIGFRNFHGNIPPADPWLPTTECTSSGAHTRRSSRAAIGRNPAREPGKHCVVMCGTHFFSFEAGGYPAVADGRS